MVLDYLGRKESYQRIVEILNTRSYGTPAENTLRLTQLGIQVTLRELTLTEIEQHLRQNSPVIAFVNTADLPYWKIDTDHAVVVLGIDEESVYLDDPYFDQAPQQISRSSFELSMIRFDYRCAVLALP
jgi:ABC-type bacteriocin/lantibiotic exporter with double-glycine peptidase domain